MKVEHELHGRRKGRNLGVFVVLIAFVVIVFGLTVVKVITLGGDIGLRNRMDRPSVVMSDPDYVAPEGGE